MAEKDSKKKKDGLGDIVWAKLKGHPWWPSIVSIWDQGNRVFLWLMLTDDQIKQVEEQGNENKVWVLFIGDNSFSKVPLANTKSFRQHYNDFAKKKVGLEVTCRDSKCCSKQSTQRWLFQKEKLIHLRLPST